MWIFRFIGGGGDSEQNPLHFSAAWFGIQS
jgi:hypothetical protein